MSGRNVQGRGGGDGGDRSEGHGVGPRGPMNDGIKAGVGPGAVINGATRPIRIGEAVLSVDDVPITSLVLALGVAGVLIVNGVCIAVSGVGVVGLHPGLDDGGGDQSVVLHARVRRLSLLQEAGPRGGEGPQKHNKLEKVLIGG